jgi:hypothetical protein
MRICTINCTLKAMNMPSVHLQQGDAPLSPGVTTLWSVFGTSSLEPADGYWSDIPRKVGTIASSMIAGLSKVTVYSVVLDSSRR